MPHFICPIASASVCVCCVIVVFMVFTEWEACFSLVTSIGGEAEAPQGTVSLYSHPVMQQLGNRRVGKGVFWREKHYVKMLPLSCEAFAASL